MCSTRACAKASTHASSDGAGLRSWSKSKDHSIDTANARKDELTQMATEQVHTTPQDAAATRAAERGTSASNAPTVLSVEDLWVEYKTPGGWLGAVRGVTFDVRQGEAVALIGESGSGKSTLGFALLRMLVRTARVSKGKVTYRDRDGKTLDLLNMRSSDFRKFRWRECAM